MHHTKPFLKWAGGKYRIIEHILNALPPGSRLVEPFTGSGAIFLNAPHMQFLLADVNPDLVNLYQFVKNEGAAFIDYCELLFCEQNNHSDSYYQFRLKFNQSALGSRLRAALFLYLNRHGYNGLCRYNLSGKYNVPFGHYVKPYFPKHELLYFHKKSQDAEFFQGDFKTTMLQARQGDVVYCDPPYVPLSKTSSFTAYTQTKFNESEQIILAKLAQNLANNGIPVVISNHDTRFTRDLYQQASIQSFSVQRQISCKGQSRLSVQEIIAVFLCK